MMCFFISVGNQRIGERLLQNDDSSVKAGLDSLNVKQPIKDIIGLMLKKNPAERNNIELVLYKLREQQLLVDVERLSQQNGDLRDGSVTQEILEITRAEHAIRQAYPELRGREEIHALGEVVRAKSSPHGETMIDTMDTETSQTSAFDRAEHRPFNELLTRLENYYKRKNYVRVEEDALDCEHTKRMLAEMLADTIVVSIRIGEFFTCMNRRH